MIKEAHSSCNVYLEKFCKNYTHACKPKTISNNFNQIVHFIEKSKKRHKKDKN